MCNNPEIRLKFINRVMDAESKLNQDTKEAENMNFNLISGLLHILDILLMNHLSSVFSDLE